jgi:branched-chain amino acid transport system permease protein
MVDPEQSRLCRQTVPAVDPDAGQIEVLTAEPARAPYSVMIGYRARAGGKDVTRFVWCGFGSARPPVLTHFASHEGPYGLARLYLLNRFWLQTPQASFADPGPVRAGQGGLRVSQRAAYLGQAFANALPSTAMTMMIAVAYALVYGLVGRINLSFGQIALAGGAGALAGASAASLFSLGLGASLALTGAAALAIGALAGRVTERLVFAPLAFGPGQAVLVATLALGIVIQEGVRLVQPPDQRWMPPILSGNLAFAHSLDFTATVTPMQLVVAGLAGASALFLVATMRWTPFGREWRAVADDPLMAELVGISRRAVLAKTFLLASLLAGLAGFILSAHYGGTGVTDGMMIGLKGLVAAVLGGIGSIGGALVGGLIVGAFEAFWSAYLPIEHRDLAVLLLLVAGLVLRPHGLAGRDEATVRHD